MRLTEIKEIAKQHNVKVGKATKSELVRSIQQAEGNFDCFDTGRASECHQQTCIWREDCER